MPVEKKGSKGSSPKVYKYYKIDGEKFTREIKFPLSRDLLSILYLQMVQVYP